MALFNKRDRQPGRISRILVVEDEPLIAFDNEYALRDAGYRVVAAVDTAAGAIEALTVAQPDLILTDLNLSYGGTGLDVAEAAREAGVPVVFVTGACPEAARALAIGCLAKPYTARDLRAAIDAVDATLDGRKPKRLPRGFTLFEQ